MCCGAGYLNIAINDETESSSNSFFEEVCVEATT